jgi:hypothetical protein
MALEIQVLAWDRHEFVAELNWVMRSHFKKWIDQAILQPVKTYIVGGKSNYSVYCDYIDINNNFNKNMTTQED